MQQETITQVMHDPIAQELLRSAIPARLAYNGLDGFPRAIPIGFLWNGGALIVCTLPNAAKVPALRSNPKVALTIDTNNFPPRALLVRGSASVEVVDGVPPEYLEASRKMVDAKMIDEQQMAAFEAEVRSLYKQMARITIVPEWAKVMDFETRLPSAVEQLIHERG